MALTKINALITLNMRYEQIMLDRKLNSLPSILVAELLKNAYLLLSAGYETSFIEESDTRKLAPPEMSLESGHQNLTQQLWIKFLAEEDEQRIERCSHLLWLNGLEASWLTGFKCIDFGYVDGKLSHALLREGASYICGLDFGQDSIPYSLAARERLRVIADLLEIKVESVHRVSKESNTIDFADGNGASHHLEHENTAYRGVGCVLKPGGCIWVYTDEGEASVMMCGMRGYISSKIFLRN